MPHDFNPKYYENKDLMKEVEQRSNLRKNIKDDMEAEINFLQAYITHSNVVPYVVEKQNELFSRIYHTFDGEAIEALFGRMDENRAKLSTLDMCYTSFHSKIRTR
ncbi:hypothetical protein [Numidum massiliense]|uniref:hypothetical protein n=1 Tax=Numidum massiliense TaxID=1522315 RepID=UPI0006D5A3DC|nr:hypothetical protein [Numidum massiliense]